MEALNRRYPCCDGVLCQSYAAAMAGPSSDWLMLIPYRLNRRYVGGNDGIVAVSSARWGQFQGVWRGAAREGRVNGICAVYVDIVSDLRARGL